jgi:predicted nuclease with TOPRIM domain
MDFASVLISAAVSFAVALGLLYLAHRSGFTDVQVKLIAALKDRVAQLEAEAIRNAAEIVRLEAEIANLDRRYVRLEKEYEALMARMEHPGA